MVLWDGVSFIYACFVCASIFIVNTLMFLVCNCLLLEQVPFVVDAYNARISCTLAFPCKYFSSSVHMFQCMYFKYTCIFFFFCKYFSSSIHTLLMHVFHVHLLFCTSVFPRQHMLLMLVFHVHLLFCTSVFPR